MILKTYIWLNIIAHIVRARHVDGPAGTRWHLQGLASLNGTRICWSTVIRLKTQSLKKIYVKTMKQVC